MNAQPLGDRVAVKPHPDEETQKNGIILLAGNQVRLPGRGTIVAVGPGRWNDLRGELVPMRSKVGDQVLFPRGAGAPAEVNDEACVLLFEGELYGTYEGEVRGVPTKLLDPRDDDGNGHGKKRR